MNIAYNKKNVLHLAMPKSNFIYPERVFYQKFPLNQEVFSFKNLDIFVNYVSFLVISTKYTDPNKSNKLLKNKSNIFRCFYFDKKCNLIVHNIPLKISKDLLSCFTNKLVKLISLPSILETLLNNVIYKITKIVKNSSLVYLILFRFKNSVNSS